MLLMHVKSNHMKTKIPFLLSLLLSSFLLFSHCKLLEENQVPTASSYSLKKIAEAGSCINYQIVNQKQEPVEIPPNLARALECPSIIDLTGNIVTFLDGEQVKLYYLDREEEKHLFNYPRDLDGISGPVWSDSGEMVMFVLVNQQKKHDFYAITRLQVLRIDAEGEVVKEWPIDKPVQFTCGSICSSTPYKDFKFEGEDKILYQRNINIDGVEGEYSEIRVYW